MKSRGLLKLISWCALIGMVVCSPKRTRQKGLINDIDEIYAADIMSKEDDTPRHLKSYNYYGKGKGYNYYGIQRYVPSGKGKSGKGYGGYFKSGKGYRSGGYVGKSSKGNYGGYYKSGGYVRKSGKSKGGYGGNGGYYKSGGYVGKSSKGYKSGKGYKGGYYTSKSGKSYGGYYKSGRGYNGGYDAIKSSKGYGGYFKSGKGYNGGYSGYYGNDGYNANWGRRWKTKKSWSRYHNYWYNYWKENYKVYPTLAPTKSPTHPPTLAPTESPVVHEGPYRHDNGSVGCLPFDSSGKLVYGGETKKTTIEFTFVMKTSEDANDDGGIEDEVKEVEYSFAEFLAGAADCTRQIPATQNRHLAALSFDPSPADEIIGECDDEADCYNIASTMTITADSNTSDEEFCQLLSDLAAYADDYQPGTVQGVNGLEIDRSTLSVDGKTCNEEKPEEPPPFAKAIVPNQKESENLTPLYYSMSALFLVAAALFVRRRRRKRSEEEEAEAEAERLRSLKEFDTDVDEQLAFGAGYRNYAINAVNVHKCHSGQCNLCNDSAKNTEFLPLANVDKWINQRADSNKEESSKDAAAQEANEEEEESKQSERSRVIENARRVLDEDKEPIDEVHSDLLDDKLRGLPTVPEDVDAPMHEMRRDKDTGSI